MFDIFFNFIFITCTYNSVQNNNYGSFYVNDYEVNIKIMTMKITILINILQLFIPRPVTTPNIMSVYWDAAKTQPALLRTLNCLNPPNNMQFYCLISKAWNKLLIALLQRARNIQTIIDAFVFNHSRTGSTRLDARRVPATIPPSCGRNLIQTILRRKVLRTPLATPTRQTPYNYTRRDLYVAVHTNRGIIKGGSLFCPV